MFVMWRCDRDVAVTVGEGTDVDVAFTSLHAVGGDFCVLQAVLMGGPDDIIVDKGTHVQRLNLVDASNFGDVAFGPEYAAQVLVKLEKGGIDTLNGANNIMPRECSVTRAGRAVCFAAWSSFNYHG